MRKCRKALFFTLSLLPAAVLGVYFAVRMSFSAMDSAALEQAAAQIGNRNLLLPLSMIQPILLSLLCGFFGYILSEKIGLLRPFRFEKGPFLKTLTAALIGGAVLSLDAWTFARWIPALSGNYEGAGTFDAVTWLASILYGGVLEEVMMRLFLMSLLAFLGWKLFAGKKETVPVGLLMAANILVALVFAAGHLPSTAQLLGGLTPGLILRSFLLNGAFGLLFGRLYRKYGIQYAMLAHGLMHVVSRLIWLIAL